MQSQNHAGTRGLSRTQIVRGLKRAVIRRGERGKMVQVNAG